ncbi:hypothetical protein [Tumebacillus flagellatus]|uniref:Uncharacterized protein n=1 Tax=Tumebacillus flagellatus TaxID=1157490 RepID=A0A074LQS0_9BACL|nr:hypothetical protein [Tumebacillus flagellatus]KEO83449.1 hypothetical protein EL26_09520 [Tumebacillus flagellatus]
MSLVLMEDLKRPASRRVTVIASFRIFRPVLKIARYTFRSGRFILRKTVWVFTGKQTARPAPETHAQEYARQ